MGSETSALDIVTVVIAGYAALVGTFALAFQAISLLRSWSTRVEVKCGRYELHSVGAGPEAVVLIRMINHSGHEVKITSVGWGQQRRKGPAFVITRPWPLELPLPFTIAPRDSQDVWTKPGMLNLDLDRKVRAQVSTSDGKLFKSKRISARNLAEGESSRWFRKKRYRAAICTSRSRGPRRIVLRGVWLGSCSSSGGGFSLRATGTGWLLSHGMSCGTRPTWRADSIALARCQSGNFSPTMMPTSASP